MNLAAFLRTVIELLDAAEVPYMLTGSLASAYSAVPRATQDLDVVVEAEEAGIDHTVRGFLDAGCYVDRDAALEALRMRGQFNAIDPESGWKVDVIIRKDRMYGRIEFDRRERASKVGDPDQQAGQSRLLQTRLARRSDSLVAATAAFWNASS